ncbi:TlpA family protein disulfide reductase [Maribacter sp. ANRC-HE7]|uniref:TlpA family protein disulfide reductase n=1 Tax=Maribacter aquimaris TaxID=2737171 RepID=A0ABR7V1X9_9FLAO|nr:TlpA disulfide reductase family protein [Maribacter aquimaris]MBD0777934.1 TlpA family protein disulfide reductase [Maribacter aquimaris]
MRTIPIKNILGLIVLTFTLFACNSPSDISGKLEGVAKGGTKLYLIQPNNLREVAASYFGKVIDSAVVNPDGGFEFVNLPKLKEPVLLEIAVHQPGKFPNYLNTDDPIRSNYMPILWQSGEPLEITANFDEFQKSFTIEDPSEINRALLALRDVNLKAYQTYLEGKQWHVEDGKQLMDKEHSVLQYQTELINFADSMRHLIPALVALRWVSPQDDYERVPEFLVRQCNKWKKEQPQHPWVEELCKQSEPANLPVLVGDVFPDLQLPMITKDTLSLKDQLGHKLTIIDLWASWCAPCRLENREVLVPIWDAYHDQGLQIVAYGLESNESGWKRAVVRDGADRWLQASDLQGDDTPILKKIRVHTIPANFILDAQGVVVAKNIHGSALKDWVKNYMVKP